MGLDRIETELRKVTGYVNGVDAAEHAKATAALAQEREAEDVSLDLFPCDDILWQGLFEQIGDRLKKRSWEVWLGTLCTMGAVAHKNLYWHYYRPLFGMVYGLLISPTGQGKGIVADVCDALLPEGYTKRDSVQSGPALFPILAKIERNEKGKVLNITPRQAILIIEEWTALLKASKIEFSNLQETLNNLFHRIRPWNVSRSDTEKSGGDREVANPTLSICATTTASLLHEQVSEKMIRSGFLNRYLIMPGSGGDWDFYDEAMSGTNVSLVKGFLDHLVTHAWGAGLNIWDAYEPEAKERLALWGRQVFNPLMQQTTIEAESLKRLHTYSHIVSLLYAWSEQARLVRLSHVEAAIYAVSVSKAFVERLISHADVEVPKFKLYEIGLEQRVLLKVQKEPGVSIRKIAQDLRKSGSYRDITQTVRSLASSGALRIEKKGKAESVYPGEAESV